MSIFERILLSIFNFMVSKNRPFVVFVFSTISRYASLFSRFTVSISNRINFPLSATASTILNGYFFSGKMMTDTFFVVPTGAFSLTWRGRMTTNLSIYPWSSKINRGRFGSLVSTIIFFLNFRPPYPLVSPLIVMVPSPPAGICFVKETAVQPQPVRTLWILKMALPLFCILN